MQLQYLMGLPYYNNALKMNKGLKELIIIQMISTLKHMCPDINFMK